MPPRRYVWLPSVTTSAPAARSLSASFGVIPTPSAMFSPLTIARSASYRSRSCREVLLHGAAAGRADDVCEEEEVQLRRDDRRGANLDRDVVAAVVRVLRERLLLDAREIDHGADLRRAAHDGAPDREGRIRGELRHRDDERGRALRLDVDLRPVLLAHEDEGPDRGDDPVDRRVHLRSGQGADVERVRSAAAELVPARVASAAAENPVHEARDDPFVRLVAVRREREGVARGAVADGGHERPRDRELELDRSAERDDLGSRRRLRQRVRGRVGRHLAAECSGRRRRRGRVRRRTLRRGARGVRTAVLCGPNAPGARSFSSVRPFAWVRSAASRWGARRACLAAD